MKKIKQIIGLLGITLIMTNFSSCSSAQKLQIETPFSMEEVSSQAWAAGVKGGGSGVNVFITVSKMEENVEMKSLYYRGEKVALEKRDGGLFIGRFKSNANKKEYIIIDQDPKKEYGNKVPEAKAKIPFELKTNEAVLVYEQKGKLKYYKIENITVKESAAYPSARKSGDPLIKQ